MFKLKVKRALLWGQGGPVCALCHELCLALWQPGNPCGSPRHCSTAAKGATGVSHHLSATPLDGFMSMLPWNKSQHYDEFCKKGFVYILVPHYESLVTQAS